MKPQQPILIFKYNDYRQFLLDWYEWEKTHASLSYRAFAKKAGLRSINFLKLVMEGQRNLTEKSILKFSLALKLNKQEHDFFKNLVFYNQAKTHEEKNSYYQQMLRSQKYSQLQPITRDQYEYYSTWYHPVVREMIVSKGFDGSFESIAKQISPKVSRTQVETSVHLLERLGLIEKTGKSKWQQSSPVVSTGAELKSHVVHNYHKLILELTKEVIDEVPPTHRDVSTMTLGVTHRRIPELKRMIQNFRQEVLKACSADTEPEEVVQLNIQMFPLTVV